MIGNVIVRGDNVGVIKKMPSESVHMVVTSPPYDGMRTYKGYTYDINTLIDELYRVLVPGGIICWITADQTKNYSESTTSMRTAIKFVDKGFKLYDTMIYEKAGVQKPTSFYYFQSWEYIFVLLKGDRPQAWNPLKDRPNKYAGTTCRGKPTSRQTDGSLKLGKRKVIPPFSMRRNVWKYAVGRQNSTTDAVAFDHPAIFPEKLAKDLILSWSNEGDVILDPFNGSGTTTKMAQQLERQWVGIDISKEYCEIAIKRLMDVVDANEV